MTEIIVFTLNAVVIYLFTDWVVRYIETARGQPLKYRQIVFFLIILPLALITFRILRTILPTA